MSKHWNPRQSGWSGQWDRNRWPVGQGGRRRRRRRARGFRARDFRLMVLAGVCLGLVAVQLVPGTSIAPAPEQARNKPVATGGTPGVGWSSEAPEIALPGNVRAGQSGYGSEPAARAAPAAVRVIDGDTFDYGRERIRIADIDTPEVNGRCAFESELAARATARLDSLLGEGAFELHPNPNGRDEDPYGRKLRIVTRGGQSVGDVLVAEGLARTWTGRREPWCA